MPPLLIQKNPQVCPPLCEGLDAGALSRPGGLSFRQMDEVSAGHHKYLKLLQSDLSEYNYTEKKNSNFQTKDTT